MTDELREKYKLQIKVMKALGYAVSVLKANNLNNPAEYLSNELGEIMTEMMK